ncbi:MAG: ATP-binding protein [Olsenella sp.]|jgi:predicted HTH transcriptional regulator|nr:ATP-binding protein [Olsenella sp.]
MPLDEFGVDSICSETVSRYRNIFRTLKPKSPWIDDSDADFLYHIGALAKGRDDQLHPTRAGMLAFGQEYEITNYVPQYLLDYREETSGLVRWDDRVVSESDEWSGNLIDFYLMVSLRLRRFFKMPFTTDEHGTSHSAKNPLDEAVSEALANALIHSYYGTNATVLVLLKPDKLTISNPGTLLMSKDVAIAGGFSETRNPALMRIFNLIGVSDRAGSGLQKIWSTWQDEFKQTPSIYEGHHPARIELTLPYSGIGQHESSNERSFLLEDDNTGAVYELVRAAGLNGMESIEIADSMHLPKRTVQRILKELVSAGLLVKYRSARTFRYEASDNRS